MEENIFNWIEKQINLKKAGGARPLVVTYRQIRTHFNMQCQEELNNLVINGKLHWGHTMNDKWFSIYDRNNLL